VVVVVSSTLDDATFFDFFFFDFFCLIGDSVDCGSATFVASDWFSPSGCVWGFDWFGFGFFFFFFCF
jgi:hypothetical protein